MTTNTRASIMAFIEIITIVS